MSDARAHIIVGAIPPATEGGRIWHEDWHNGEVCPGTPDKCGEAGCGFLGRILAIEAEARAALDVAYTCGCGIYVHPTRRNPNAIHIPDCEYAQPAPALDVEALAREIEALPVHYRRNGFANATAWVTRRDVLRIIRHCRGGGT